jgi:predicted transposase/invertase (TIGR01784 family)
MDYAMESGLKKGFDKGMKQGIEQGMKQGIEQGMKQGMQRGIEQGRAEGEKQGRYEVAQKLLAMGLPIESVLQATGLSKDDVKQLMSR